MKENWTFGDFKQYMFKIDWCLDAYEPISSRVGMMIDITKLYIFIPVSMTLTFNEVAQTLAVADLVRQMTPKKACKYSCYGLFEHLLFSSL